jgi:hypothetical protein
MAWFLSPETKKLVIPFLSIYLFASLFICALCIPTLEISQTSPDIHAWNQKYHILCLPTWPQPIIEYGSSIRGRWQDGAKIEDFKVSLQRKKISSTYLLSITPLPEDEQMSKHGGRGRYNAN